MDDHFERRRTTLPAKLWNTTALLYIQSTVLFDMMCLFASFHSTAGSSSALICLLHLLLWHLDSSGESAWILFVDLSTTFNTSQRHLIIQNQLNILSHLIHLIHRFLIDTMEDVEGSYNYKYWSAAGMCVEPIPVQTLLHYSTDCTSP